MFILAMVSVSLFQLIFGSVIPGQWGKVEILQSGTRIVVDLKSGGRITGTFLKLGPTGLSLIDSRNREKVLPKAEVQQIALVKEKTYTHKWKLIGLAAGFGGGAILGASIAGEADWEKQAGAVILGVMGAGIGTLVGWGVDRTKNRDEVIYRSA